MAQKPQIIDITRSYVPGDPNSYPENLISTQSQDGEEKAPPVSIYEGYNFLPTPYGYKSYFGTTSRLDIPVVPARVQFMLSYQSGEYINNLIALCEDGIWIIDPTADTNTWKHVVVHTFEADVFEEWTWCVIENSLYCYKQAHASYYHTSDVDDVPNGLSISIVTVVPTFLNMAGQMGIFKAGTRLGFWDSANSVGWSSNLDLADFTPSLENLAGNTIFGSVVGRITHVRDHGEGFIVYSTKSIVGVSYDASSNMLWDAHTISNVCGVAVGREVTHGSSNSEHFAYTTAGMYRVGGYNGLTKIHEFQQVAVELSDLLKESRDPVYLDCIEGRYLYMHCISNDYINGKISFESYTVDGITIDTIPDYLPSKISPGLFIKKMQKLERDTVDAVYGATLVKYSTDGTPFDVVEWEVSYKTISPLGLAEKYKEPSLGASFAYADGGSLDRTSIGWDNRTATAGVFLDTDGVYASLEGTIVLPTKADFINRATEATDDFVKAINALMIYQEDALGGTYSNSYKTQKALGVQPSYLPLVSRTNLGMIEGLYNVESLWKDFEKRQQAAKDRLVEILDELEPFDWTAYSTSGTLEGAIEAPVYEIFNLYKPRGCVGVQQQGKGFFFYKQYRDMWDCIVLATREVETFTAHKMIGESSYEAGIAAQLKDQVDITITMTGTTRDPQFEEVGAVATLPWVDMGTKSMCLFDGKMFVALYSTLESPADIYETRIYSSTDGVSWGLASIIDHAAQPDWLEGSYTWNYSLEFHNLIVIGAYLYCVPIHRYANTLVAFRSLNGVSWERVEYVATASGANVYKYMSCSNGADAFVYEYQLATCKLYTTSDFNTFTYVSTPGNGIPYQLVKTSTHLYLYTNLIFKRSSNGGLSWIVTTAVGGIAFGYCPWIVNGSKLFVIGATSYTQVYSHDGTTWRIEGSTSHIDGISYGRFAGVNYAGKNFMLARRVLPEPNSTTIVLSADDYYDPVGGSSVTYGPVIITSLEPHSPTFLRDLVEESQVTGIYFAGPDLTIALKDLDLITNHLYAYAYNGTGVLPLTAYNLATPGLEYQALLTVKQGLSLNQDYLVAKPETPVQFRLQKESAEMHEEYPYLITPSGVGEVIGYYQSFEQSYLNMAMYARYLRSTMTFANLASGKQIQGSPNIEDYYIENDGEYIKLWCTAIKDAALIHPVTDVIALLHQNSGFVYEYDVYEEPQGSVTDSLDVALTGASIVPTLDVEGVFNTVGGFFSPKNKISCTLNAGVLTAGASTAIGDYAANSAEILDFLQPANNEFLTAKYLLPPTYDDGERWYLIESADQIYETGTPFDHEEGKIASVETPVWSTPLYLEDFPPYDIPTDDSVIIIGEDSAVLPGASFNLQEGTPAPSYPTFTGAYVFDLGLKKWGKLKASYKTIFPFAPLNANVNGSINYTNFGMDCGIVLDSMQVSVFDTKPADSWIRIGKIGYYRLGMTNLLEVKAMFRNLSQVTLTTDSSMDGRTLSVPLRSSEVFTNTIGFTSYPDVQGRWHTIKIEGNYDLQYLEIRGTIAGRR